MDSSDALIGLEHKTRQETRLRDHHLLVQKAFQHPDRFLVNL